MASTAVGAHVCHVMPSIVITVCFMSAVSSLPEAEVLVTVCGKNRKTITITVTVQSMIRLKVIILERRLRFAAGALPPAVERRGR